MGLSFDEVRVRLSLDGRFDAWRGSFDASLALLDDPEPLRSGDGLRARLREIRTPVGAIAALVESRRELDSDLARHRLLAHGRWLGRVEAPRVGSWNAPWTLPPRALGETGRLLYPLAFVAEVPRLRRWHEEHGIPDEVSLDTVV